MTIVGDLERARRLIFAADEMAAKELLLSLGGQIEEARPGRSAVGGLRAARRDLSGPHGIRRCRGVPPRITDCLATYESIRAGTNPELAAQVTMSDADIDHIICRYSRRAQFLRTGLAAAAHGDHEAAEAGLLVLTDDAEAAFPDLAAEHGFLVTYARILCATALCDDDLHVRSVPLWEQVIDAIEGMADGSEFDDFLLVLGATGYGRFCVETGRLAEAEPWLQRAGARAERRGWKLATARTQLERATASWAGGDRAESQRLVHEAYPAIAEGYRAHDVSRCWLYFGLISLSIEALDDADERFGHAERHWREVEKPLHIHRILVQRSWVDIFRGRFEAAAEKAAEARELLDSWPRRSWLQYAQARRPSGQHPARRGAWRIPRTRATKLQQAADLKVPAALAVDSVRHCDCRCRRSDAVGHARLGTHPGGRVRRRLGVGQHRTPERACRISQRARSFQHRADRPNGGLDRDRDGRGAR